MADSELKARIQEDRKTALRNQDKQRLGTIQLILAAIKQWEVDERKIMTDEQLLAILDKMVKQRRESITQYQAAKRQDLIDQENFELKIIQEYLPQPLTEAEISALIESAISTAEARSVQDMGKVMNLLRPQLQGRADIAVVSATVKQRLA